MTLEQFKDQLTSKEPPALSPFLIALWYDARNDWEMAHSTIQDMDDINASWIHAYLHRKEGDIGNADYWYRRAARKRPASTLKEEWEELTKAMIDLK